MYFHIDFWQTLKKNLIKYLLESILNHEKIVAGGF